MKNILSWYNLRLNLIRCDSTCRTALILTDDHSVCEIFISHVFYTWEVWLSVWLCVSILTIEYYIYREDTIINGYTLLYLSKNNHLLDKNKVKEKDYLYIGTLLNLEYSCSNCMELYHNRNQDMSGV